MISRLGVASLGIFLSVGLAVAGARPCAARCNIVLFTQNGSAIGGGLPKCVAPTPCYAEGYSCPEYELNTCEGQGNCVEVGDTGEHICVSDMEGDYLEPDAQAIIICEAEGWHGAGNLFGKYCFSRRDCMCVYDWIEDVYKCRMDQAVSGTPMGWQETGKVFPGTAACP